MIAEAGPLFCTGTGSSVDRLAIFVGVAFWLDVLPPHSLRNSGLRDPVHPSFALATLIASWRCFRFR